MEGKVAIVTGASSGIGLACARKLAAAGARVALVARTRAKLEEAAAELGAERAAAFPVDVTDFAALDALVDDVIARFGGVDILINNAGLNHRGPILRHSAQELADIITTNLTAPIYLTRAVAAHIRAGGAIVNVASIAGMVPVHDEATYSASKAGLRAFTRSVAEELAERDVHVGSVCPGPVDTGFFGDDLSSVPDLVFSQPMSSAEEIADAIVRCIDERVPELAVPPLTGRLATVGYLFPSVMKFLRPTLEKRGAVAKQRFIDQKRR